MDTSTNTKITQNKPEEDHYQPEPEKPFWKRQN
jgi:hypothetical protein